MAKLVWRVKLVTELQAGETTEVEVARIERDQQAGLSDLGLRLAEPPVTFLVRQPVTELGEATRHTGDDRR
jgi:hypothetical protein